MVTGRMLARLPRGVWSENPALVQLLGLCPLLAVSTSAIAGAGLGFATIITMVVASTLVSAIRGLVPAMVRLPVFVIVVASAVTAIDLVLPAFFFDLHRRLGLFIPLIVTNCVVLARLESFASSRPVSASAADGLAMGTGFAVVLVVLGAVREAAGTGCVLAGADMLLPVAPDAYRLCALPGGLLIALTPPGAFFALAGLIVLGRLAGR